MGPGLQPGSWFRRVGLGGRLKLYLLDIFPYPSGYGLHVGHPLGYIGTDVYGRYLVDAARGGDTSARTELVRRYKPLIALD
jgi:hypothetical protein